MTDPPGAVALLLLLLLSSLLGRRTAQGNPVDHAKVLGAEVVKIYCATIEISPGGAVRSSSSNSTKIEVAYL